MKPRHYGVCVSGGEGEYNVSVGMKHRGAIFCIPISPLNSTKPYSFVTMCTLILQQYYWDFQQVGTDTKNYIDT